MASIKADIIAMIEQMPDDISVSDIMAELYFRKKVDAGLKALDEGEGIPHEQVKERMKKWLN